ncbi:MAG: hypothetical protein NVS3B20_06270 [Polyangiales bacterium]
MHLERIALHQTRLRTPGLALDPSGVALGARGLVLLPTLERLVTFLASYTREHSVADLLSGAPDRLEVISVRSPLGTREIVLSFPAISTTLLDLIADVARLAKGLTFTGGGRYYVQYRDRNAPFGYDALELLRVEEGIDFALHHSSFSQTYAQERVVDLADLMIRLEPRRDPTVTAVSARPLWVSAEQGIAPALVAYLSRSAVDADVGVVELPSASSFDVTPRRLAIFRIPALPQRLERLLLDTPGFCAFAPAGKGAAVQVGYRHPINLTGLPVFSERGLALLPAATTGPLRAPIVLDRLPQMASVTALLDLGIGSTVARAIPIEDPLKKISMVAPLRLAPSLHGDRNVVASLIPLGCAALVRRLAYALPTAALENISLARIHAKPFGDFLILRSNQADVAQGSLEVIPLGAFFSERSKGLLVLAGHDLLPACAPDHLAQAMGASATSWVFVWRAPGDPPEQLCAFSVASSAFTSLSSALVAPESWGALMPIEVVELAREELEERIGTVSMESVGIAPMRGVL